jgi:aminoglycoside phosphotransferase (APT) family kinase protein
MSDASATHAQSAELAPVRSDEQMDWINLEAHLLANLDGLEGPMEVLQFPGGHANLTYLIRFSERELVVRRPPLGPVAPGAHDMAREFKVLSKLWRYCPFAPRAFLLCEDADVIGATFFAMERRTGVVARGGIPPEMAHHDDVERRLSFALVDAMAELHSVDPEEAGLSDLGRPIGFVARQVSGWKERWDLAKDVEVPVFEDVFARLEASLPESSRTSIVHNDIKLDNCQFDPTAPDRVKSIFDWDMATLGDPLIDLGTLLGYWAEPGDAVPRTVTNATDMERYPRRAEIAAHYAERTGVPLAKITWYEAFAIWKSAVVLQQIYIRYKRGQTKDERFAKLGSVVPLLSQLASDTLAKGEGA